METKDTVSLNISKDIVNPIVEAKVKEAIMEAMGGRDQIIDKMVNLIINQKVDRDGRPSNSSYDKETYLDFVVTNQIKKAIQEELTTQISIASEAIKDSLVKNIQTKKGANMVAMALLSGMNKTFENSWTSKIDVIINQKTND